MLKSMGADRHTDSHELPHVCTTQRSRLIEATGDDEEGAAQPMADERGQRVHGIRRVAVIKRDADPRVVADDREKLVELRGLDPIELFIRLQRASGFTDAVEAEVDCDSVPFRNDYAPLTDPSRTIAAGRTYRMGAEPLAVRSEAGRDATSPFVPSANPVCCLASCPVRDAPVLSAGHE